MTLSLNFNSYISNIGFTISDDIVTETARILSYELSDVAANTFLSSGWADGGGFRVGCTSAEPRAAAALAKSSLDQYTALSHTGMHRWSYAFEPTSCIVFDPVHEIIFLIADPVGAVPLWYHVGSNLSTQSADITLTTDLFGALSLGLERVSSVAPGMVLGFDLRASCEVFFAQHWTRLAPSPPGPGTATFQPITFAYRLLARIYERVIHSANSSLLELDVSDPSSRLLSCAVRGLGLLHGVRYTAPLAADWNTSEMPLVNRILGNF